MRVEHEITLRIVKTPYDCVMEWGRRTPCLMLTLQLTL